LLKQRQKTTTPNPVKEEAKEPGKPQRKQAPRKLFEEEQFEGGQNLDGISVNHPGANQQVQQKQQPQQQFERLQVEGDSRLRHHPVVTQFKHQPLQVSISPTFYKHLFLTKMFCKAFMCLQFGFVIIICKDIRAKAACKLLMKFTLGHPSIADSTSGCSR